MCLGTKAEPPLASVSGDQGAIDVDIEELKLDEDVSEKVPEAITSEAAPEKSEETPDDLLRRSFLAALKHRVTKEHLPLDIGDLYVNYVLKSLPPGKRLDVKKTSDKKFSAFLKNKMAPLRPQLLRLRELGGKIEVIDIDHKHELLYQFIVTDERIEDEQER